MELEMLSTDATREYRSPDGKLLRFFEKSRAGWKKKYRLVKIELKRMTNRANALERSRDHWKELARQRKSELHERTDKLGPQKMSRCQINRRTIERRLIL